MHFVSATCFSLPSINTIIAISIRFNGSVPSGFFHIVTPSPSQSVVFPSAVLVQLADLDKINLQES
jgi:hypothetical protein